ncbi:MAG: hypothetical protein ABSG18_07980 [Steroidobacteraceae bacterium]|jgi:hypothetical protein
MSVRAIEVRLLAELRQFAGLLARPKDSRRHRDAPSLSHHLPEPAPKEADDDDLLAFLTPTPRPLDYNDPRPKTLKLDIKSVTVHHVENVTYGKSSFPSGAPPLREARSEVLVSTRWSGTAGLEKALRSSECLKGAGN